MAVCDCVLAQPAELVKRGGEIAAGAEEEREEWMLCASAADEGGGEAGHSLLVGDFDAWLLCWKWLSSWVRSPKAIEISGPLTSLPLNQP